MTRPILIALALLMLAACASGSSNRERSQMMDRWEVLVRWNEFDALLDFIHPEYLAEYPVAERDLERLNQFRVTEYRIRRVTLAPDGESAERLVRLRMYHKGSSRERVVDHRELWRYDEDLEAWLLHSGLPDPSDR
jgi:hypothetical protein